MSSSGKIDAAFLPSYVDDVAEFSAVSNFPSTGETGKLYIAKDTNFIYRWTGSTYIQIGGSGAAEVDSVFGRTGPISAQSGDYAAFYVKKTGDTMSGTLNAPTVNIGAGSSSGNPLKLIGNGVGNGNSVYLPFYESDGSTLQGYIGFPSSSHSSMLMNNATSGQWVGLENGGGTDGLRFYDGSTTRYVYHTGNDSGLLNTSSEAQTKNGQLTVSNLRTSNSGGGSTLLTFNTERPWRFVQLSTGASTALGLQDLAGGKSFKIVDVDDNETIVFHPGNGTVSATAFYESSDRRLKQNIKKISPSIYSFEMKKDPGVKRYGTIAQITERTNPELVETADDGLKSVNMIDFLSLKLSEAENKIERLEFLVEQLLKA